MKRLGRLILLILLSTPALAQDDASRIFFDAIPFAAGTLDSTALDIYLAVPYRAVEFERSGATFNARYQARIRVESSAGKVYDSTFTRTIRTNGQAGNPSDLPGRDFYQERVSLPHGDYTASVELIDLQTNLVSSVRRSVVAIDHGAFPFSMSGLLLVGRIREDSTGFIISPMLTEDVSATGEAGFFLFFEAYNNTADSAFDIEASYKLPAGTRVASRRFARTIPRGRSQQWVRLENLALPRGIYAVELKASTAADTTRFVASAERNVRIEGGAEGMPILEDDLDEKIAQLRYVGTQNDIDALRSTEAFAERRRRFAQFWEKLDPTPGTGANEAMAEYYNRIDYANRSFRSYAAGWLTDKGRVYIIYGAPDRVETDPFRTDGRVTETWHYYSRSIRLHFFDESGFGDFRLSTPLPPGEKYRYGR
jgi:GWxTD domain-containing protein